MADHTLEMIVKIMGPDYHDNMGTRVAGLGDLNHDGFSDVGVTVPGKGKTYIYYGGNPMDDLPDLQLRGPSCVAAAGDVNGDSYDDVITSDLAYCYIFFGSGTGLDTVPDVVLSSEYPGDYFGHRLIAAGDLNKDDYDDLLVLAPNYLDGRSDGKAYLYYGGDPMNDVADWELAGNLTEKRIQSVGALDFNGDGWIDIAVGKLGRYYAGRDSLPGEVDIFFGGATGFDTLPDLVINPIDTLSYRWMSEFGGWWVSGLGDLNGDGYDELGVLLGFTCGHPLVYLGGSSPDTSPAFTLGEGLSRSSNFVCGGDVNHDGFPDVVNGDRCWGMGWGAVEVYLGSAGFNPVKDNWITAADLPPDFIEDFGRSVSCAGDVNGDGVDDIIASSDNYWVETNHRGEVFIFAGDTSLTVSVNSDEQGESSYPVGFTLGQNYPNPFNASTVIPYSVRASHVSLVNLRIYNLLGQEVRTLVNEPNGKGDHQVVWNGENNDEKEVSSGIYFYKLECDTAQQVRRMLLIR
jgi:hypothetical protein